MTDLTAPVIQSPEQYREAKVRLKRLQETPSMDVISDIVVLRNEIEKYENTLTILAMEPGFSRDDEHG